MGKYKTEGTPEQLALRAKRRAYSEKYWAERGGREARNAYQNANRRRALLNPARAERYHEQAAVYAAKRATPEGREARRESERLRREKQKRKKEQDGG